jgi:predicted secreted acid phosphatase
MRVRMIKISDSTSYAEHIPPLKVVLWMGDNIRDFPALTQVSAGSPEEFGTRYFVLPNPMYGSWVDVARH